MSGPSNTTIFPIYAYFLRKSLLFDRKSNFDVNGLVINYFWNILIHLPPPLSYTTVPFILILWRTRRQEQICIRTLRHKAASLLNTLAHSPTSSPYVAYLRGSYDSWPTDIWPTRHLADTTKAPHDKNTLRHTVPFLLNTVCRPNFCRSSVFSAKFLSANCLSAKCHVGQMSCRRHFMSAKCPSAKYLSAKCRVGQMSCRPNVMSAKCRVGQMSCRPNVMSAKCRVGEISCRPNVCRPNVCRPNVVLAKVHVGQMSCRWNFMSAKCLSAKCRVGKMSAGQMSAGQMSVGQLS